MALFQIFWNYYFLCIAFGNKQMEHNVLFYKFLPIPRGYTMGQIIICIYIYMVIYIYTYTYILSWPSYSL